MKAYAIKIKYPYYIGTIYIYEVIPIKALIFQ